MVTTRHARTQTLFYNPSANSQNTSVPARGKLRNPGTRQWIHDTTATTPAYMYACTVDRKIDQKVLSSRSMIKVGLLIEKPLS